MVIEENNQLRALSHFLMESQQRQHRGLAQVLNEQVRQNLALLASQIDLIREWTVKANTDDVILSHLNDSLTVLEESKSHLCEMACLIEAPTGTTVGKRALLRLTNREREVLQFLADGKSTAKIAKILQIGEGSVRTYRARMMKKLQIDTLAGLVKFAIRNNLTSLQ